MSFIVLIGVAVLLVIAMASSFNELPNQGITVELAVVREAPSVISTLVLITASIATLGLEPILFTAGPISEIKYPIAEVPIGVLITSTILTLCIQWALYKVFSKEWREKTLFLSDPPWTTNS